jgi:hypothetical protein
MTWLEPLAVITEKNAVEGEIRVTKTTVSHKQNVRDAGLCVPDHLQDLFHRSCKHLDQKKKLKVAALLRDFPYVFAKDGDDTGRTDLAKHSIDTGDSKPLRQAPRRLPIGQREEVTTELAQMLQHGLIEPYHAVALGLLALSQCRKRMER